MDLFSLRPLYMWRIRVRQKVNLRELYCVFVSKDIILKLYLYEKNSILLGRKSIIGRSNDYWSCLL